MKEKSTIKDISRGQEEVKNILRRDEIELQQLAKDIQEAIKKLGETLKDHQNYFGTGRPETQLASLVAVAGQTIKQFRPLEKYNRTNNQQLQEIGKKAKQWLDYLRQFRDLVLRGKMGRYETAQAHFNSYIILHGMSPLLKALGIEEKRIKQAESNLGIEVH